MYNLMCVTNRHLSCNDFLTQINKICKIKNEKNCLSFKLNILLREKDLDKLEYKNLAKKVIEICKVNKVNCILHTYFEVAEELSVKEVHVPIDILRKNTCLINKFNKVGVSIHSLEEAIEAEKIGASYVIAGNVFETQCKKGLKGKGLDFIRQIKEKISIPLYAIGGINKSNVEEVLQCGADGICIMSGLMKKKYPEKFFG